MWGVRALDTQGWDNGREMEAGADTRHWVMVSCIRLPIVRSERRSAVAAAVVLLLTVSTLPLHIGPKQFSNTLVMMILTHCLWAGILWLWCCVRVEGYSITFPWTWRLFDPGSWLYDYMTLCPPGPCLHFWKYWWLSVTMCLQAQAIGRHVIEVSVMVR